MPYDLTKTHYSLSLQKNVASGEVVDREGVLLQATLESGEEVVKKADASAADLKLVGFAISDNETIGIIPVVVDATVPAAPGPYTVQLSPYVSVVGTPPNSSMRVEDVTAASDLTEVAGAPAATQFQPNVTTGLITFNSNEAGHSVRIYYRANLTVAEARLRFFQRSVNNEAGALFSSIVVGGGIGEIYTAEYDTNVDWSAATSVKSAADGLLTDQAGAGTVVPGGRVIHVPDPDGPYLGIAFSFPS